LELGMNHSPVGDFGSGPSNDKVSRRETTLPEKQPI